MLLQIWPLFFFSVFVLHGKVLKVTTPHTINQRCEWRNRVIIVWTQILGQPHVIKLIKQSTKEKDGSYFRALYLKMSTTLPPSYRCWNFANSFVFYLHFNTHSHSHSHTHTNFHLSLCLSLLQWSLEVLFSFLRTRPFWSPVQLGF